MSKADDQDHDQRFKVLLQEFVREFIRLFFPKWYRKIDWSSLEWLTQEVFLDPPRGEKRTIDLVAKVKLLASVKGHRPGEPRTKLLHLHIEVEADDRLTRIRPRMHDYYKGLRDRYKIPVLPIALYLRVGLNGRGWDTYREVLWGEELLRFRYPYVGLPGLQAREYIDNAELLGAALASMMRLPEEERVSLRAQVLQRIVQSGENDDRKYLLTEFVDAYWTLDNLQQQEFNQLVQQEPYKEIRNMQQTTFEKGQVAGELRMLQRQIEKKFGPLSPQTRERIQTLPFEDLKQLGLAILDASSLSDLGLNNDPTPSAN